MSLQKIPATNAYRQLVAAAAANGTVLSPLATMAFGTGDRPYSPDSDTTLQAEFTRVACTRSITGVTVTARGVLGGAVAGSRVIREVGVFTSSGVLAGRRVIAPKELEAEAEIEIEVDFEY